MQFLAPLNADDLNGSTTERLREAYLMDRLFDPGKVTACYIQVDRHVVGTAIPLGTPLGFPGPIVQAVRSSHFLERRELAIVNLGGPGRIAFDDRVEDLAFQDGLYLGRGTAEIEFQSVDSDHPAKFYFHSLPAHCRFESKLVRFSEAPRRVVHQSPDGGQRWATQLITPETVQTCQVTLGLLSVERGERWVTMPPHTHPTRSEIYCYFDVANEDAVFHFLGQPHQTKHIVARNEEVVFAPGELLHFGVGTGAFSLVWSMGGENRLIYDDMEDVEVSSLR